MDYPTEAAVVGVYREIFGPEWSIQKLASSAIQGHLLRKAVHEPPGAELVGRSIVWKLLLAVDSPLDASTGLKELRRLRGEYVKLLKETMRAPDGTFPDTLVVPGEPAPTRTTVNANLAQNNPLSLDESNPWQDYFASLDLRKTIAKDVERTFPDVDYFRSENAQRMLADVLFVYTKTHESVSYRQGMHELLAPILWALDYDSLDESQGSEDSEMREFLAREYVPADAWALFSRIMAGAGEWYEWREPKLSTDNPRQGPWVAPINLLCAKIGDEYLKVCDPALSMRLNELGIEPQMYGIRWLRLLFTREFSWRDALVLWDALFAADSSLELAPWICVAMLMRIRNLLIPAEYTTALTYVLQYPPPPVSDSDDPLAPNSTEPYLLVQQALMLRANPVPATGATIVLQNRSVLGIPIEAPSPAPPVFRGKGVRRRRSVAEGIGGGGMGPRHRPDASLSGLAAFGVLGERADVLASRLWDMRGTVQSRVADIRRNLPDLVRTPSMTDSSDTHAFPYYQSIAGAGPGEDFDITSLPPPPESVSSTQTVRTRFDIEREVREMKALMRTLAEGVGVALKSLKDGEQAEAMQSLEYIQQVLSGKIEGKVVDSERILGSREYARRQEIEETQRIERAEQAQKEEQERGRAAQERRREKERQEELAQQEPDPLQASPVVRSAPLQQTSPPRMRTTRAPWERSEHSAGRYPLLRPHTPPQLKHSAPSQTLTHPALKTQSSLSPRSLPTALAPGSQTRPTPLSTPPGPSDPLGVGPLG